MQNSTIASRLEAVRAQLPPEVELVAVSKFHPAEALIEAYRAGQRHFGESRPQEMVAKRALLPSDVKWHMIGHLQTNKVRDIVPFVAMIESLDSARLAAAVQREAARIGRRVDVLLEIHVADEASKTGWDYAELCSWLDGGAAAELPNLRFRGVMGMATNTGDEAVIRRDFLRLRQYKEELAVRFGAEFDTLSMGMSGDYPIAIACGATSVRIGTSIFGQREY